jgi:hypothetical protein
MKDTLTEPGGRRSAIGAMAAVLAGRPGLAVADSALLGRAPSVDIEWSV